MNKILVIADIHGKHEMLVNAFEKFLTENYTRIVLLGDLADSFNRTNDDILRCFKIAFNMKELLGDKMVWLIGNHELHYIFPLDHICSGYRPDLAAQLNPWLNDNLKVFKVAHQEGNYLFSHAGIQKKWYSKHLEGINKACNRYGLPLLSENISEALNGLILTHEEYRLCEVGMKRGGLRGDYGGPFWCDREEMESYGPISGFHQIVGHTPVKFIERVEKFEGDKHYNNTSVTFCDILDKEEKFLTLEWN